MVLSLNSNKKKILCILLAIAVIVLGAVCIPKMIKEPIKFYGETNEQRINFLQSFGYKVSPEPIDSRQVTIPKEFNDIYSKYNDMQQAQGFDLKPYKGKVATQYIYIIEDYPGTDREIHGTLLVHEGLIIGGDVCCAEADGFMHGFAKDSEHYGGGKGESSSETVHTPEPTASPETETAAEPEPIIDEEAYPTD